VVVDADTTTGGAASHTIDQLEQVGGNVIGSVLNRFDPSKARYYSYAGKYAYAYRYQYRHEDSGAGDQGSNGKDRRAAPVPPPPDNVWR
jgi:Mrp family chromosome partitioning ATPase